jgi:hypothetical protein
MAGEVLEVQLMYLDSWLRSLLPCVICCAGLFS